MDTTLIAGPLAAALEAKGYSTLTQVQNAVIAEHVQGRDALVSAQTGSGKTVAFGLAMAPEILNGADRLLFADTPLALAIAPTRELALQVARELEWLYAEAGAVIATCVGGMDYRTEKRALDRGAHIVVGTPGRLRDHIERKSLDLSGLRAAVLDEADEMLDLGFRDDLEFILSAAPEDRRTLMFSATVPREIAALAEDFQNDALRIQAGGEAKQHGDIEYRAYSVVSRDKENAIFNTLRFHEAQTAIVFCKTRANVNNLLARMGNRGFKVVALSGELSQQERTHALQSLRDGRANVCIATDVAARGIDLPGLELVIHADLPSNSETLLHRSGRTGRAGSKGVSALIVPQAELRKAQRLLQGAKVVAEWGNPPSADEVQAKDDERIVNHPALAPAGEEAALAQALVEQFGAESVAAAFIRLWREGRSAPEVLTDVSAPAGASAPRDRGEFGDSVWFQLSVGHTGRAEARWLLPKLCEAGGITKNDIGAIRIQQEVSFVQIAKAAAPRFGDRLTVENGIEMERMAGEPSFDRPERGARPPRPPREDRGPRPSRDDRPARAPREERSFREDRPARTERPAYGERSERPPYGDRPARPAREKAPYQPKPSRFVDEDAPRWSPEDGKDALPREAFQKDKKPRWKADDRAEKAERPRSSGFKSHGPRADGDKPRSTGFKSHGGKPGDKPRSEGFKSHGGDKPYGNGPRTGGFKKTAGADARPTRAKPKFDAKDTSKRFTPPKKG
ncbi:DEAD/DEAH box helicase [Falsirhodobacter halotolerans]|uniref:DEAD/DEAH box helicase n=1 Tax=Falsirhodobacter halotolerans TaxID=1146892 RepID=UPI001FD3050C|nr:DEAD/DEAH box helicase [Falsirhodobacter halotolerans]MCJ8140631.1 DEAD/DEAH box helicase [Falsirhodobacter halotolerans]